MLITAFILFVNRLRTASFHDRKRLNFERLQIMLSATQKFTFDKDKRLTQKKREYPILAGASLFPKSLLPTQSSLLGSTTYTRNSFLYLVLPEKVQDKALQRGSPSLCQQGNLSGQTNCLTKQNPT